MAHCLISCKDYKVIRELPLNTPLNSLPAICQIEEDNRKDGYAVIVTYYGTIVADSEGLTENEAYCTDHATMTGMYDRY